MSRPTKFLDLLNNTLRPTERINTVTGFDLWLFRLVAKIAKGFTVVKRGKPLKHQAPKDLSRSNRPDAKRTAVLPCVLRRRGVGFAGFFGPTALSRSVMAQHCS